jgi:hypothetical protein
MAEIIKRKVNVWQNTMYVSKVYVRKLLTKNYGRKGLTKNVTESGDKEWH